MIFRIFPSLGATKSISAEIIGAASNFNAKISEMIFSVFQQTLLNLPTIAFSIVVILFTFFFALREGPSMKSYVSAILPLSKEHKERFYKKFEQVTESVIYGHVIGGIVQGSICGIAYFMFGVPNALLLTAMTIIAAMLPVIGAWLIWMPADFFLFANGNNVAGMQLLIFGLFMDFMSLSYYLGV